MGFSSMAMVNLFEEKRDAPSLCLSKILLNVPDQQIDYMTKAATAFAIYS